LGDRPAQPHEKEQDVPTPPAVITAVLNPAAPPYDEIADLPMVPPLEGAVGVVSNPEQTEAHIELRDGSTVVYALDGDRWVRRARERMCS
jgi:hypothetical protein